MQALVIGLIVMIVGCFLFEVIFSQPKIVDLARGFFPNPEIVRNRDALYIAIGILGATVMPHNLYLHSSIVQTRIYEQNYADKAEAIEFATLDSTLPPRV